MTLDDLPAPERAAMDALESGAWTPTRHISTDALDTLTERGLVEVSTFRDEWAKLTGAGVEMFAVA